MKQILRQVVTNKDKSTPTQSGLEVNILQFLYEYLQRATQTQLNSVHVSLMSLMKEGLQLSFPPALFLLLAILQSYVQRLPLQEDRKVRKELQVIKGGKCYARAGHFRAIFGAEQKCHFYVE